MKKKLLPLWWPSNCHLICVNFWSERSKGKVAEREAGKILPHHLNESYSCLISVVSSWWAEEADGNKRPVPVITPSAPYHPSQIKKKSFRTLWKTQEKIPYEDSILFCLLLFGLGSNLVARVDLHWLTSHTKSVYTDKLTLNISLLYRYLISQVIIYYTNSVQMHLISSLEEIQLEYDKRYSLLFLSFTWDALETEEVKKLYWNLLGFWTMT